jgi:RNA-binding protein Nova
VLAKLKGEKAVADSLLARDGVSTQLRMLVPAALCGTIIGKGGATIRSFAEDSKANITVSLISHECSGPHGVCMGSVHGLLP